MKDELETRIADLEARIALLEVSRMSLFLPYVPTYPQPWYPTVPSPTYDPTPWITWDGSSTDDSGWSGDTICHIPTVWIPDEMTDLKSVTTTSTERYTTIDGERFYVVDESPPGMTPLSADAGILHVR